MSDEADVLDMEVAGEEEQPAAGTEGAQGAEAAEENDGPGSLFEADGKKLNPQIKVTLQKIRETDPKAANLVSRAVFKFAEMEREFPGGLTEVRELRDKVEEFGGLDGIEEKLQGAAELDGLAKQYMDADPAFVEDMVASSPESFAALAPIVFQKYAEVEPDAFASYVGRLVYSDFQRSDLPLMMMRLADTLGDNQRGIEAFNSINAYLGGFKKLADNAPAAPKPGARPAARNGTDQREEELRSREWNLDRQAVQKQTMGDAFTKAMAGRKPSTEERAEIMERFGTRAKIDADRLFPGWKEKSQKFIRANDKAGYLRFIGSIYKRVVPDAMAQAVNRTMKGKAAPTAQPGVDRGAPAKAAPPGFVQVAKEPSSWDIDYGCTNQAMLKENRAVLKDGKKVTWR
jgi:signal recognition particle subunit SEC65